jgi:hypothetical protein
MNNVVMCWHNYVPHLDHKYFNVLYGHFLNELDIWGAEVDRIYLLDSTWDIDRVPAMAKVVKVDPNKRYWEAYEDIIPELEGNVLFMDNDMLVHKEGIIKNYFDKLSDYGVISIYDTIGPLTELVNQKWPFMGGQTKFCPYFFMSRASILQSIPNLKLGTIHYDKGTYIKELDYTTKEGDWGETLGEATIKLLDWGVKPLEVPEDKSSTYIDGHEDNPKRLGYYHIRAGATPAYLLTHRNLGDRKTYDDYIANQPKSELLRQLGWYWYMNDKNPYKVDPNDILEVVNDCGYNHEDWLKYMDRFISFHL